VSRAVDVCVAVPRLELDRPFTYLLPDGVDAPTGTLVSVPFHGRTVKGWVLGAADDVPARVLRVRRVLSRVPLFGEADLRLYRWVAWRYVAPLGVVIDRAQPPRVAGEEAKETTAPSSPSVPPPLAVLEGYGGGRDLLAACAEGQGAFVLRPLPDHEAAVCVEAVAACVAGGRDAIVLVPEGEPLPATARAVVEVFGEAVLRFAGGGPRERYRKWLDLLAGHYRVVVGTRPSVFAPVRRVGLVWVNREAHPGHREERAPYHHVREVALVRARLGGAVCVLAAHSPSAAAAALADRGEASVVRASRQRERAAAPLVETARPLDEDRSPRVGTLVAGARSAFLLVSRRGYGVARVCRTCGEPARCAVCSGPVAVRRGHAVCAVCGADGRCPSCGGTSFGLERGGAERVREWAARITGREVTLVETGDRPAPPSGLLVGTATAVKDFGPMDLRLVAVLDADRARRRAGLTAPEQVLATWFEAAAWAAARGDGGRVLVQTREPGDPAVQALVRWDPWHFHRSERGRLEEAGFPPGFPVFRVVGREELPKRLRASDPFTLLESGQGDQTVCLVTVRPDGLERFRATVLDLVSEGMARRVEAEPQF
jgi:primosomal protein N' (replication factor Y) (superfamily II helicase)